MPPVQEVTMEVEAESPRHGIEWVRNWHTEHFGGRVDVIGWRKGRLRDGITVIG